MLILRTMIVLILAGCASHSPTDDSEYQRLDSAAIRMEHYREYTQLCQRSGGRVTIERRGMVPAHCARQFCPPGPNDHLVCTTTGYR